MKNFDKLPFVLCFCIFFPFYISAQQEYRREKIDTIKEKIEKSNIIKVLGKYLKKKRIEEEKG